jgi:hypothetical protein
MKKIVLLLVFGFCIQGFSQVLNKYQYVVVPTKFDFMKVENEHRLNTIVKNKLEKMGFIAYYENNIPLEVAQKSCEILKVDLVKGGTFVWTKMNLIFKDCQGKVVFQSDEGKSKDKDFKIAYTECTDQIFESLFALKYKFEEAQEKSVVNKYELKSNVNQNEATNDNLIAEKTSSGYVLKNNQNQTIYKVTSTGKSDLFLAQRDQNNGMLYLKDGNWIFEYTNNDQLFSEIVKVKF